MDLALKGKRALVCGASSGLGYAAAISLAAEQAEVIINGRNKQRLERAGEQIQKLTGISPTTIVGDIGNEKDIEQIIQTTGDIDILVSNGGGPPPGQFTDLTNAQWEEASRLVLFSAIKLTRGVIDGMIKRKWGRLIYITSIGVLQPVNDLILSNTFRSGVTGFCKTISNNYSKHGITANCVCPGYTKTTRLESLAEKRAEERQTTPDAILKEFASAIPAGRVGKPEELAALITFLASDKAAYITGSSIAVDGGYVQSLI